MANSFRLTPNFVDIMPCPVRIYKIFYNRNIYNKPRFLFMSSLKWVFSNRDNINFVSKNFYEEQTGMNKLCYICLGG